MSSPNIKQAGRFDQCLFFNVTVFYRYVIFWTSWKSERSSFQKWNHSSGQTFRFITQSVRTKFPFFLLSVTLDHYLKNSPHIPTLEHTLSTWLTTVLHVCMCGFCVAVCLISHTAEPLEAFCWAARSLTVMVTGNGGAVNALRRGNMSAFSPAVNLQDHRDWRKPPTCRGWTPAAPRDAQMRHRVTGGEGPAWCKSGKTWTHPEVRAKFYTVD